MRGNTMTTLIHITHEAHEKMGGIGAVLEGLLTTRAYQSAVDRTLLVGAAELPLKEPVRGIAAVLYQTGQTNGDVAALDAALAEALPRIEATYGVRLLYGRRDVPCPLETRHTPAELLLIDVRDAKIEPLNQLKRLLWESYTLESNRFEKDWGYEEWVRLAAPAMEAVHALLGGRTDDAVLISHEFMGLPTVLAARLRMPEIRTVYWAHEVPSVRDLLEQQAAHRTIFHQAIETQSGLRSYAAMLREWGGFKHALVTRAHRAHRVFAVSDRTAQELHLLSPDFQGVPIDVVYNGLPVRPITIEARLQSRAMLRQYVESLVGFRPDFVFTHVARPVASKAIERDLAVLDHLDDILAERGESAVLLLLATDGGQREPALIRQMETEYGWPVNHRLNWPDLVKGEIPIGQAAEEYNKWARTTRTLLLNQFGFSREACGQRVPEGMTLQDLRQGSDVEFGQSAYEPFGIAQLETLAFGGISVITRVCGCAELLARVAGEDLPPNVLIGQYAATGCSPGEPPDPSTSRRIEHETAARLAKELAARLPKTPDDYARLLDTGWTLAEKMSWQAVCSEYFVPALNRCLGRPSCRPSPEPQDISVPVK